MKHIFRSLLLIFFAAPISLQPMIDRQVTIDDLKPLLNDQKLSPDLRIIEKIKKNDIWSNIVLTHQSINYLVKTNHNNPHALGRLVPIFFDTKTINDITNEETLLENLSRDSTAFNNGLYAIAGCKVIFQRRYNLGARIFNSLKKKFVQILEPLKDDNSLFDDFIRVNDKNFVTLANNNKDYSLNLKGLTDIELNKIEYWKNSLQPTFYAETITKTDASLYQKKLITLYCCFKQIKREHNIVTVKPVINNLIIPYICSNILTQQCSVIYNDIQKAIITLKSIKKTEAIETLGSEQYNFFINEFEHWYTVEIKKMISFENVKQLFNHHK